MQIPVLSYIIERFHKRKHAERYGDAKYVVTIGDVVSLELGYRDLERIGLSEAELKGIKVLVEPIEVIEEEVSPLPLPYTTDAPLVDALLKYGTGFRQPKSWR